MTLEQYRDLIRSFVAGEMPVSDFERRYLAACKAETEQAPVPIDDVLNELFFDVDAYDPTVSKGEAPCDWISEKTLRERAAAALHEIEEYLQRARCT